MMISTNEQRNSATFEKDGPGGKAVPVPMSLFVGIWFITKKEISRIWSYTKTTLVKPEGAPWVFG